MEWWTKEEREKLDDLYESAIGSDNTDYILEKLTEIYNMIWNTHIATLCYYDLTSGEKLAECEDYREWELVAVEKEKESDK